jgi:hypothetical protein
MAYHPCFFCRSDGCRVSASNLTAKTCPPIELLPMALDRCHASFQIDGPDYFGISPWLFPMVNLAQLLSDLTVLVLSGNLDGIQLSPSSFFSVNFYCARFLQCACFLQCCSSCAFTSKSPNSAYPAISVVAIKDNHHQHTFVACSIFANTFVLKLQLEGGSDPLFSGYNLREAQTPQFDGYNQKDATTPYVLRLQPEGGYNHLSLPHPTSLKYKFQM